MVYACIFFQNIVMFWLTMDFRLYGLLHVKNTGANVVHGVGLNIGNLSWQPTRVSNKAKRVNMCLHLHNGRILVNFHTMMTLKTSSVNFTHGFLRQNIRNWYVLKENKLEVARLIRQWVSLGHWN